MFGAGAMTNAIPEIREADLLFVIGSNTTEAHPIIGMEMKRAVQRGARLFVADPRRIWLADYAEEHLALKPGTDVALLNAIAQVIVSEDLIDQGFISAHTENYQALQDALSGPKGEALAPEAAEEITGVPAAQIRKLARAYATTKRAGIYYTLGITEHSHGTDNVYALANLVLMTGHLGLPSAGLNPLRGQNNVQGANDAGASPIYYPGYQRVDDDRARQKFEAAWGVPLDSQPGLNLNQMMKEVGEGSIKGMFVMGEDILLSEPNVGHLERAMNDLEFLVMQDILPNETMRFADVIFPAACFAEKEGVFTNSDRRVQRVRKAVEPPGEARPDWEILCELARAVGYPMPNYSSSAEVYDEMASLCPSFKGISHARLDAQLRDLQEGEMTGLQWPCPEPQHPGTPTLHQDGPIRGKGFFQPVVYRESAELPDPEYPLLLSTGRTLYQYNASTQTRREERPSPRDSECFIEMHRYDARQLELEDGHFVKVSSRRGAVRVRVRISPRMRPGCVWMPLHFAEARANLLTNDVGDSVTGTAEYKVCAVRVEGDDENEEPRA